jgi:hypothetical protein
MGVNIEEFEHEDQNLSPKHDSFPSQFTERNALIDSTRFLTSNKLMDEEIIEMQEIK